MMKNDFRFPLKKSSLAALSSLDTEDWHTAFHSTRPNLLREDYEFKTNEFEFDRQMEFLTREETFF